MKITTMMSLGVLSRHENMCLVLNLNKRAVEESPLGYSLDSGIGIYQKEKIIIQELSFNRAG